MKTECAQIVPLVTHKRRPTNLTSMDRADPADVGDPLPYVVNRQADGTISSRQTRLTEVAQETADDN